MVLGSGSLASPRHRFLPRAAAAAALTGAALGSTLLPAAAPPAVAAVSSVSAVSAATRPAASRPGVAYRTGVVCAGARGTSVLASWPSAATGDPAFALGPVTAGPGGTRPSRVATDAATTAPYTGRAAATLAALLAHRPGGAAATADTAAAIERIGGLDPVAAHCLGAGTSGVSTAGVDAAWAAAGRLAGPYTVRLRFGAAKLIMGRPTPVDAEITAASGTPLVGMPISFASPTADARLTGAGGVTDSAGRARVTLTVPTGSTARAVEVAAHVRLPGTPVVMSAPGAVSLVAAGPTGTLTRTARIPVDTTADPHLSLGVDRSVVLPGTAVRPSLTIRGMRGHDGAARLALRGPLRIGGSDGCRRYVDNPSVSHAGDPAVPVQTTTEQLEVSGDGTVAGGPITLAEPGCYVLSAGVGTSNAIPNVHRSATQQVIAVAPVRVTLHPVGNGVNIAGPLSAIVRVTGSVPARLSGVQASLVGPGPSDDGSCAHVHLPDAGAALTPTTAHGRVEVTSPPVGTPGCYAFRVLGTLRLPGLGSVPLAWRPPAPVRTLLIAPTTTVDAVSAADAGTGDSITATVTVSGTYTQAGAVRLRLLHLPYDWRGCVGRDWTHADRLAGAGPAQPTTGDGSYRVRSAAVPASGCWTVVPVLGVTRNRAISVTDTAAIDPTAAVTVLRPAPEPAANRVPLRATPDADTVRLVATSAGMLALLIMAVGATVSIARRDEQD